MPNHPKTFPLSGFSGLNNVSRPERTDPKYLKEALNIDIDKTGGIQKRLGYSLLESGSFHSLWSKDANAFAVKDDDLVRINPDLTTTVLKAGVYSELSFDERDGLVYFTGESVNGVISGDTILPWGIEEPNPKPTLSATGGGLSAGTYQVALTYVRANGLESGSSVAQQISVGDMAGITLSNLPSSADPEVTTLRVYASTPDGEVEYLVREVVNGTTSLIITSVSSGMMPLPSFNRHVAPTGHITKIYHQRAFIAEFNTLWYSDPYSYNWFDYHKNFMVFPSRIRALMPVEGGLWVAADRLYYLIGKDVDSMRMEMKEPVQVVPNTEVQIPGAYIFIENTPIGYKWLVTTNKGVYILFNDGIALNMTEKNVSFPEADSGAAVFVQQDGINRYLSILDKKKESNNTAVGDLATGVIIRNGVALED